MAIPKRGPSTAQVFSIEFVSKHPAQANAREAGILMDYLRILVFHFNEGGSGDAPDSWSASFANLPALILARSSDIDTSGAIASPNQAAIAEHIAGVFVNAMGLDQTYRGALLPILAPTAKSIIAAFHQIDGPSDHSPTQENTLELIVFDAAGTVPPSLGSLQCSVTSTFATSTSPLGTRSISLELACRGTWTNYQLNTVNSGQALELIADLKSANRLADYQARLQFPQGHDWWLTATIHMKPDRRPEASDTRGVWRRGPWKAESARMRGTYDVIVQD